MCTGWCPLAADWGTVSDVLGVGINAIGTAALVYLAFKANRLVGHANKVAEDVATHEKEERAKERSRAAKALFQALLPELEETQYRAERILTYMGTREPDVIGIYSADLDARKALLAKVEKLRLLEPIDGLSRLHLLDEHVSTPIARAVALAKSILADASEGASDQPAYRGPMVSMYFGNMYRELRELRLALIEAISAGAKTRGDAA